MSDWDSDGDDVKPAAPIQPQQRYDQNRDYGNDQKGSYGNDGRDYGNNQRNSYQQQDQNRDNRQNFGGGRRDNQQNFGNGRRDDNNYRNGGNQDRGGGRSGGGGYNRYGGSDFKMEVDSSKVGMIIGKGGSKIREIQEKHNVNVKIGKLNLSVRPSTSLEFQFFLQIGI